MHLHFILVKPARGENVGFATRALKTMGFTSLRLVSTEAHFQQVARKTAYGSHDLLDKAQYFDSLTSAVEDVDLIIGTTAKSRIKRYDGHAPKDLVKLLANKLDAVENVGLVFGSEENGLSTEDLDQCDLISTIPLAQNYPSLNLAQSILIYAYELRPLAPSGPSLKPSVTLHTQLKQQVQQLFNQLELERPLLQQRIHDRLATLSKNDIELMLSVLSKLLPKIDGSKQNDSV